jgi:hypothetical protein
VKAATAIGVLGVAALIAAAAWLGAPVQAQPAATPSAPPLTTAPATMPAPGNPAQPPLQTPITAEVAGFRSARFGMTQDQVREAIKGDFGIEANEVKQGGNDQEKTKFLAIRVTNLVPDSGLSVVTYIFGYTSQKLIHVNVTWGKPAGQAPLPNELVTTGRLLQQYFQGQGFARDTMIVNRATNNGSVVLFNGFDEKKRSVMLLLLTEAMPVGGPPAPAPAPAPAGAAKAPAKPDPKAPPKPADGKPADGKPGDKTGPEMQLVAVGLQLSYVENATSPDVFRIQRGKF